MNFKQLKTFLTAARTSSFSETAQLLGYAQSAVTTHIRLLESHLDTQLFDRCGRGVKLTSAGKNLLQYADQLLLLKDKAEQSVRQVHHICGEITIAGYETALTYRLPQILSEFAGQYSDVQLNIVSLKVEQLKSQLKSGQIDVAFIMQEENDTSKGELEHLSLGKEKVILIAHPNHDLAKRTQVNVEDLHRETVLLTEPGCNYRKRFEDVLSENGPAYGARQEFVSIEGIKSCVRFGMGVAAITEVSVKKELELGELTQLSWAGPDLSLDLYMIWNSNRWISPALRVFLDKNRNFII